MDLTQIKELELAIATGRASTAQLEAVPVADVVAIKREVPFQVRAHATETVDASALGNPAEHEVLLTRAAGAEGGDRVKHYVASSEHVDRMGDIIRVYGRKGAEGKGWDLTAIKTEPVFLWSHDSGSPPIGMLNKVWRTKNHKHADGVAPALLSTVEYLSEDLNPVAETVWKMVEAKVLRTVSVGFMPQKDTYGQLSDEEKAEMALGPWGIEFTQQELLELSQAVVPANPFALETSLKAMVQAGAVSEREARAFAKIYPLTAADVVERVAARVRSLVDFGAVKAAQVEESEATSKALADICGLTVDETASVVETLSDDSGQPEVAPEAANAYGEGMGEKTRDVRLHLGGGIVTLALFEDGDGELYRTLTGDEEAAVGELLPHAASVEALDAMPEQARTFLAGQVEASYAAVEALGEQLSVLLDALQGKETLAVASEADAPTVVENDVSLLCASIDKLVGTLAEKQNTPQGGQGGAPAPEPQVAQPEGGSEGDDAGAHKDADPTTTLLEGADEFMAKLATSCADASTPTP